MSATMPSAAVRSRMLGKPDTIAGIATIANAMIVSTTSNSTKVKPGWRRSVMRTSLNRQIVDANHRRHYRHDDQCDRGTHDDRDRRD